MALFRPGPLVAAISGTVGGVNFVNTRNGLVLRKALVRTKKQTALQLERRAKLRAVHGLFLALSTADRAAWAAAAENVSLTNRLGLPNRLTTAQFFCYIALPQFPYFPTNWPAPPFLSNTPPVENVTFTLTLPNTYNVDFDFTGPIVPYRYYISTARPVTSRPLTRFPLWRRLPASFIGLPPTDIKAEWLAAWGEPVAGETVAVKVRGFSTYLLPSYWVQASTTVT